MSAWGSFGALAALVLAALLAWPLARFIGLILAAWLRPIEGLVARPFYALGGVAMLLGVASGALAFAFDGIWARGLAAALFALAALTCAAWFRGALRLTPQALVSEGLGRRFEVDRRALRQVRLEAALGGSASRVAFIAAEGAVLRMPLTMDGLDSILAQLARDGVDMPPWAVILAAYQRARGRRV